MGKSIGVVLGIVVTAVGLYTGNAALIRMGVMMLASAAIGAIAGSMSKKPSSSGATMAAQGRMETIRQPLGPRQIVLGRCRVGGVLTYFETTADKQTAHMIVTYTGHPVKNIRDIYFNDLSAQDYGAAGAGAAATGRFVGYSTVYRSDGTEGAAQPFSVLASAGLNWAATDLQRDCAKVHTSHLFSNDVWQTGLPVESAVIDGAADIYDPRVGSPGTNRWTNNPALCVAWYLTFEHGLKCDYATEINEAQLIVAANICDERVTLVGTRTSTVASISAVGNTITLAVDQQHVDWGDGVRFTTTGTLPAELTAGVTYYAEPTWEGDTEVGQILRLATSYANLMAGTLIDLTTEGSGTITLTFYDEPRYRLNGAFNLSEKPEAVLERMLAAMAGSLINSGGVWYIYAGAYEAPTLVFDEDDFAGSIQIQTAASRREIANAMKGSFVDPSSRYQPVEFPPVQSQTYFEEDGGERIWRDLDLTAFVTSSSQAQRLAKIDLVNMRQGLTATARFKLSGFRMMTGSTIAVTHAQMGWDEKVFLVTNCTMVIEADGRIEVDTVLKETSSTIYDWSASEEQLALASPNTNLPDPTSINPPTSLAFTQSVILPDRGTLSWTAPADYFVSAYQVEYKKSSASTYEIQPPTTDTSYSLEKLIAGEYNFRVKAINNFGASSSYATTTADLFSANVVANYGGSLGFQGVTKALNSQTINAGNEIYSMAYCPVNNKMYGAIDADDAFSFLPDPTSATFVNAAILPGYRLLYACYDPVNRLMWFSQLYAAGSPSSNAIIGVDPITDSISIYGAALGSGNEIDVLAFCPGDNTVWGCARSDSKVMVFAASTGAILQTFTLPGLAEPRDIAYCPTTNEMWVGDRNLLKIHVFELNSSPTYNRSTITTLGEVRGISYCPSQDKMVVSVNNAGAELIFINPVTRATSDSLNVGFSTHASIYCKANDRIYVTDFSINDSILTVVPSSKNFYEATLTVSGKLRDGAFCPVNNLLYFGSTSGKVMVSST